MIIDFTIKNYRSFKEAASISLLAEPLKNDGIAISTTDFKDDILPVAGIFGQNAGGKSNFIKALLYMKNSMLNAMIASLSSKRLIIASTMESLYKTALS